MKKICVIVPNLFPLPSVKGGAIETLVTNVISENEKEKKLDLTVISIYDEDAVCESKKYKNTKFIYIKKDLKYCLTSLLYKTRILLLKEDLNTYNHMALQKIKKEKFDYIVVEGGKYECFDEYLKYFKKEQMILHIHHKLEASKKIDSIFENKIAVSNYIGNYYLKSSESKKKNMHILTNGVDLSKFEKIMTNEEKEELRQSLGIKKDDFVVIFCGRLIGEKGVLELIKAIKQIKKDDVKLIIVGSFAFGKNETSEYIELLNKESEEIKEKIITTGFLDYSQVYKYYAISNVQAVPSLWEEAGALVLIEGRISSLPLIATISGGVYDYAEKEATIFINKEEHVVEDLKNAILSLYNDRARCKTMGQKARENAKRYDKSNYYNDFINVIDGLNKEKYGKE